MQIPLGVQRSLNDRTERECNSCSPPPQPGPHASLAVLDEERLQTFHRALLNLLSTHIPEFAYAQLLDGLPTEESLTHSYAPMRYHPVHELRHAELCDGALDKARELRSNMSFLDLTFDLHLLDAFNASTASTDRFNLRLIELVVVACHQIGAYLFNQEPPHHSKQLHEDWVARAKNKSPEERLRVLYVDIPPCAFFHAAFMDSERYPMGKADVAGYWAEGKIFGGVVVFDRGETDLESKSMWMQNSLIRGPHTLYPPTPAQYEALVSFLLSDPNERPPCPLPIHGTPDNIPRWDASEAFAHFHIFRDRHERRVVETRWGPQNYHRQRTQDWPEQGDELFLINSEYARGRAEAVDEEAVKAAERRLAGVTPTSPCWRGEKTWRKPWW